MKDNKSDLLMNRTDNLEFEDLFNLQDIQKIQDDFANALGIASIITKPDGTPITNPSNFCRLCGDIIRKTEKGLADCIRSNAISEKSYHDGPVLRKCLGCGLWDAGTSMFVGGQHIANWLIGQIRDEDLSEDNIIEYANHIGVDEKVVVEAFREIPVMSLEKLNDKLSLLHSFSQQISNTAFQNLMQAQLIESMNETENALSKNEEEIQSIFRAAPAGIGVVCNRILTKVNDQLCEMIGYSKEELLGHSSRVLYPNEEEFNYVGREKYSQIKSEGTGSVETKFLCKDGRIIDVLLSSTPLDFQDFEKGVTFTVLDITYLKNKEKELLESERKYRTMLEVMEDPVYICSTDMTVEYMNPAMEKIIGSNMQGKKCYAAVFGHDSQCPWCIYDKIKKDKDMTFDIRNPKNNRDYHISCSPIVHLNNETSMLAILRDVTDFKLLHSNLQQSQKMESIGTLAGGIAHDFNNILSPIIGYVELAKDNLPFESQEQSYLSEVLKATDRASELVRQILTFSRNSEFELKPISPHKIVTEALKLIRASLPSTIEVKYQPGVKDNLIIGGPSVS